MVANLRLALTSSGGRDHLSVTLSMSDCEFWFDRTCAPSLTHERQGNYNNATSQILRNMSTFLFCKSFLEPGFNVERIAADDVSGQATPRGTQQAKIEIL